MMCSPEILSKMTSLDLWMTIMTFIMMLMKGGALDEGQTQGKVVKRLVVVQVFSIILLVHVLASFYLDEVNLISSTMMITYCMPPKVDSCVHHVREPRPRQVKGSL